MTKSYVIGTMRTLTYFIQYFTFILSDSTPCFLRGLINPRAAALSGLCVFAALAAGCEGINSLANQSVGLQKMPQNQVFGFAPPLTIKIERTYWTKEIDQLEGLNLGMPAGVPRPERKVSAQNMFLVIELAVNNNGNQPGTSQHAPVFNLLSSSGTRYESDKGQMGGGGMTVKLFDQNVNPGQTVRAREIYDVPRGEYELHMYRGNFYRGGISRGDLSGIWLLSPTDGKE